MKKLLVPIDFSDAAFIGADAAMDIAKKIRAEVQFFTVFAGATDGSIQQYDFKDKTEVPEYIYRNSKELLRRYESTQVPISLFYTRGPIEPAIERMVEEENIYQVVMGSNGADGLKSIIGSHAQHLTNKLDCPVLVVKHEMEHYEFKRIVFASDFRLEVQEPFRQLVDFASHYGAHIDLLYVTTIETPKIDEFLARKRMEIFENLCWRLPVTSHVNCEYTVRSGIKFFTIEHDSDLLVMVNHGDGPIKKLMHGGSISESMVNNVEIPIMTYKAKKVIAEV